MHDHMSIFEGSSPTSSSMEELSPARAFKIVNGYLGWGDPAEKWIWFIGIEEADPWGKIEKGYPKEAQMNPLDRAKNQIKRFEERTQGNWYSCATTDEVYKPTRTPVFRNIAQIVCKFSAKEKDCKTYREKRLFREGCRVFQTNLFPLGKPKTTEWPDYYKQLFGYGKDDIRLYEEEVENTRFPEILRRWSEGEPQATICLGQDYVHKFKNLFGLPEQFNNLHPYILCDESRKILITQHFSSPHWNKGISEKLEVIAAKLAEWKLTLP